MFIPGDMEFEPLDIPDQPICLDGDFWEGIEPYMLCPEPIHTDSIGHIEGTFDTYRHEFDT